ncbi:MAG TPA: cytochrome P450 [Xanthobacteraceae bacterium]|nr:cytochrome P450 [Xanthobacteraceae bacterium]
MFTDPDLVPFEPPPQPLGLRGLPVMWRNYIESIPRGAYEEGVVRIRHRHADTLLLCEPDIIGEVLVEKADNFERDAVTRRAFAPTIGRNSLFLAEGADWRWQRRAVAPIFRHEALMSFVPVFLAMADRQVEQWRSIPPGEPVDAAAAMTRTTFNIIVETMLGGSASLDADCYSEAIKVSFATIPWHIVYAQLSLPEWMPYPHRRRAARARNFLHQEIGHTVKARRAATQASPDLLDLLLKARDPESGRTMTDEEVVKNLITFITAGHETTSVALTWTLWLLAKDQATQQRVADEVAAIAGSGTIGPAEIDELSFCRQVIQEAMRLFPPAPAISRFAKAAMTLGGKSLSEGKSLSAGLDIDAGARVHIPVYALHRNTRLWPNPNAFDPDRFAPELAKTYSRYAFMPFGGGARICIGASFAMIEATAILATLIRALRFHPVPGHKPKPVARVTLRPKDGMPLLITPR